MEKPSSILRLVYPTGDSLIVGHFFPGSMNGGLCLVCNETRHSLQAHILYNHLDMRKDSNARFEEVSANEN